MPSGVDENLLGKFSQNELDDFLINAKERLVIETALLKGEDILSTVSKEKDFLSCETLILSCDTAVFFQDKMLGKPKDSEDAKKTLTSLSGKVHEVITGFCIFFNGQVITGFDISKVLFNSLSQSKIDDYVKSGLPLDKAGSYGIQDGFEIVDTIEGEYDNIMGFPTQKIIQTLKGVEGLNYGNC